MRLHGFQHWETCKQHSQCSSLGTETMAFNSQPGMEREYLVAPSSQWRTQSSSVFLEAFSQTTHYCSHAHTASHQIGPQSSFRCSNCRLCMYSLLGSMPPRRAVTIFHIHPKPVFSIYLTPKLIHMVKTS